MKKVLVFLAAGAFFCSLILWRGDVGIARTDSTLRLDESEGLRDAPGDEGGNMGDASLRDIHLRMEKQRQAEYRGTLPTAPAAAPTPRSSSSRGPLILTDCSTPLPPVAASTNASAKIAGRFFPSIFQAWTAMDRGGMGGHDLVWGGLKHFPVSCYTADASGALLPESFPGQCTAYSPSLPPDDRTVRLLEIRWHDGMYYSPSGSTWLPADSPYWLNGGPSDEANRTKTTMSKPAYRLDHANQCFQKLVAAQCQAAVRAGFDGCFFDWWSNPDAAQVEMLRKVRAAIGDALIIVNANGRIPADLSDVNGVFAEGFGASFFGPEGTGRNGEFVPYPGPKMWQHLIKNLRALRSARRPQINAIEGWGDASDERYLRALTALVLVHSNAYVLYSRPNQYQGLPDHSHSWSDFWNPDLGRPLDEEASDPPLSIPGGAVYRSFTNGIVVYNPTTVPVSVPGRLLEGLHRSHRLRTTLSPGMDVSVPPGDGDIFIR